MANNNIEIEAKVLLSKNNYEKLLNSLNFDEKIKIQKNYYLDSTDRILEKYSMMLRLREREGKTKLTLKAPLSQGLLEKNQNLSEKECLSLSKSNILPRGEIYDFLEILHIPVSDLKVLAQLTTERKEMEYKDTKVNISKNTYGDNVDYEIECDSDCIEKSEAVLKEILSKYDIECKFNNLSKENRAINSILKK